MKPLPSIRGRLLRAQLVWSLLWGLALAAALSLAVHHEEDELLDESLHSAAEGLIGPLVEPLARAVSEGAISLPATAPRVAGTGARFVWQLVGRGPAAPVILASPGAPARALQATATAGFANVTGWRVYGMAVGSEGRMLYVAQNRDERAEAKMGLVLAVLLAGLPMVLLGLLWLNARVRHDLQPLQDLSDRLAGYDPLRPGSSLGPALDQELQPVHAAIDALAARLAHRVAHERAFAAHAAHALRTPLAGIDAQLAVALREAPVPLRPRLQRVRAASVRLQRAVTALLAMFRSGAEVERQPLDLATLAARVPVEGLVLQVQPGAALQGDADLLTAALLNLLDNAQRHGAHTVTLAAPGPGILSVHDDGSGASPERRAALQAAIDAQDYAGRTGLGLMLADLVARAHGGSVELPEGPGFTVWLRLGP